ncbi:MAG: hypothetical protein ABII13_05525 [Patescibacteria group bacterium]|nr:hypothetical protein [Patescibacteria group bacterium]MBU2509059.1 hypothetical protein [Patescibacteria group bacterium]
MKSSKKKNQLAAKKINLLEELKSVREELKKGQKQGRLLLKKINDFNKSKQASADKSELKSVRKRLKK